MNNILAIKIIGGIVVLQVLVYVLKHIIKQRRPQQCVGKVCTTWGMPSGRATLYGFLATILAKNVKEFNYRMAIFLLSFVGLASKVILYQHSYYQLLAGYIIGSSVALVL